jgi:hypothetical protein
VAQWESNQSFGTGHASNIFFPFENKLPFSPFTKKAVGTRGDVFKRIFAPTGKVGAYA